MIVPLSEAAPLNIFFLIPFAERVTRTSIIGIRLRATRVRV